MPVIAQENRGLNEHWIRQLTFPITNYNRVGMSKQKITLRKQKEAPRYNKYTNELSPTIFVAGEFMIFYKPPIITLSYRKETCKWGIRSIHEDHTHMDKTENKLRQTANNELTRLPCIFRHTRTTKEKKQSPPIWTEQNKNIVYLSFSRVQEQPQINTDFKLQIYRKN